MKVHEKGLVLGADRAEGDVFVDGDVLARVGANDGFRDGIR